MNSPFKQKVIDLLSDEIQAFEYDAEKAFEDCNYLDAANARHTATTLKHICRQIADMKEGVIEIG